MTRDGKCESVLVVDDDADFRALMTTIGQICGVPVIEAADCSQAVRILGHDHSKIKLVILDYCMPGMEPSSCVQALRAKAGARMPIVLLTAAADPAARAAQLRISRWVAKPVDIGVLQDLLVGDAA